MPHLRQAAVDMPAATQALRIRLPGKNRSGLRLQRSTAPEGHWLKKKFCRKDASNLTWLCRVRKTISFIRGIQSVHGDALKGPRIPPLRRTGSRTRAVA